MPTFRPLHPGEVEIEPPIFSFHVEAPVMRMSADEVIGAQHRWNAELATHVAESGGVVYLAHRWVVFFGYPTSPASLALNLAGQVRQRMSVLYPNATMLSVSTVGLAKHSHIHAHLSDHLDDSELPDILLARIKFKEYDDYLNATERSA